MNLQIESSKKLLKNNIQELINQGRLEEAENLLDQYITIVDDDIDIYSIKGVIHIIRKNFDQAEYILKKGIIIDGNNFDLNYNLAYLYEVKKNKKLSDFYYQKAYSNCEDDEMKKSIESHVKIVENKKKIAFFVKSGMDSFLDDIILGLAKEYEAKKIIVTQYNQIDKWMEWADICWFEWCDELVAYGSRHKLASEKKIICRLHSYEAFTDYINNVSWDKIDDLIFISESIKENVLSKIDIIPKNTHVIPNGIDMGKYTFRNGSKGKNIAYVGYLNYKKGPMLLLHAFKAIYDYDKTYKLYIAGMFQDERYILYFEQMIKEMGIENNVFYEGWQDNLDQWMEDKDYILCTSVLESQNISVMQAMAKGIKPLVHNFVGAKDIYESSFLWNTTNELIELIRNDNYNSHDYRKFINERYSLNTQMMKIQNVIENKTKLVNDSKNLPLVTIGIINYNYGEYLRRSIDSVINQTYKNIEILITDDCSTDDSKIIIEEYRKKYPNINVIYHEKNSGTAIRGIKEVIEFSKGEFYSHLSADDYFDDPTVVEKFMNELLMNESLDYVYGNIRVVDVNEKQQQIWKYRNYSPEEVVYETFIRGGSAPVPITNGIGRKRFYRENNLEWLDEKENTVAGDTLNVLVNIKYGWNIKHIDISYISYRQHNSNMTQNLKGRITSLISVLEYIVNNFDEEIYIKDVNWKFSDNKNYIESMKCYIIGTYYYELTLRYLDVDKSFYKVNHKEIKEYIQPFIKIIDKYFSKSVEISELFKTNIDEVYEKLESIGIKERVYDKR